MRLAHDQVLDYVQERYPAFNWLFAEEGLLEGNFEFGGIGHLTATIDLDVDSLLSLQEIDNRMQLIAEQTRPPVVAASQ